MSRDADSRVRVLVVEDDAGIAKLISDSLGGQPYRLEFARTGKAALAALKREPADVLLLDLGLPDMDGRAVLKRAIGLRPAPSVVVVTGNASLDVAVESMRLGAFDYVVKPWDDARLSVTIRNALEHRRLANLVTRYRERYEGDNFCGMVGASPAMRAVYRTIEAAAASNATIFITGESGTGKELCAVCVHGLSSRSAGAFVALNCAAIPAGIMESEIFGHVKGAFTGAVSDRGGAALRADGGTLFLDEICDLPLELQSKLLRLVQTGQYQPVGSDRVEKTDIRFVCATNRDPLRELAEGRFREDLYYRMHVIPIDLPPLRARDGDIALLAAHFLAQYAEEEGKSFTGFTPEAAARLDAHSWPGNVRELQNVIRRVAVLSDGELVTADMLPPLAAPAAPAAPDAPVVPLSVMEHHAIERAIEAADGNVAKAAALLGIDRATVYRKRRKAAAGGKRSRDAEGAELDAAALDSLEKSLGADAFRALVARQLDDLPGLLDALTAAEARGERSEALQHLDEIKSLAAAFGAHRLQKIAADLEAAWTGREAASAPDLLKRLTDIAAAARTALAARYGIAIAGGDGARQSPYQPNV